MYQPHDQRRNPYRRRLTRITREVGEQVDALHPLPT
jgi:hypothetical protein